MKRKGLGNEVGLKVVVRSFQTYDAVIILQKQKKTKTKKKEKKYRQKWKVSL